MWRRRVGGALAVVAAYGPTVALRATFHALDWHWLGGVFQLGELVGALPGVVLVAVFAPEIAYRRRDALTLLFPPRGIFVAWITGARVAQLPNRDWPARTDGVELPGRQMARVVSAANRWRLWRQGRAPAALGHTALPGALKVVEVTDPGGTGSSVDRPRVQDVS
jgi:hypothetical protein